MEQQDILTDITEILYDYIRTISFVLISIIVKIAIFWLTKHRLPIPAISSSDWAFLPVAV